ncbi:GIY-YIG nuclease family protein [Secundilactobacillus folii]|uniref:GIY-YIG nuclease family protein n=1 Tax=Secundilactobacillus folii TaxID=2678357 RepID=A0A7X3C130_9LACO|nr:GIY-YIG nuclease family protein [Secundilactobacillus folii]
MSEKQSTQKYYFYVLLCADNTLYGGFSTDVYKRFEAHQQGRGAKYTRVKSRHPLKLIYFETFLTKSAALKAEYAFKHQSRRAKERYLKARGIKI